MSYEKKGVAVSHGFVSGNIILINQARTIVEKKKITKNEIYTEINRLQTALELSLKEISELKNSSSYGLKSEHIDILDFNILVLEDEILVSEVIQKIKKELINAEWALNSVLTDKSKNFSKVKDLYMQERLADFYYIAERLIKNLRGKSESSIEFKKNSILLAHDLSPLDALKYCQNSNVVGLIMDLGGPTSHTAIIARSLNLTSIMSLGDLSHQLPPGQKVYVDGYKGIVSWQLKKDEKEEMIKLDKEYKVLEENLLEFSKLSSVTKDKFKIFTKANIEIVSEINSAIRYGAEGIGMYRTEFLFTSTERFPTQDEQFDNYINLLSSNHFDEVTIRTLDIGGDKLATQGEDEINPAMGVRGIRYSLANVEMFADQIEAILRVCNTTKKKIKILLPMISTIEEIIEANEIINNINMKYKLNELFEIGVVIETPSAALITKEISSKVDFISIGTNDLIQYVLAADRNNKDLRSIWNYYQPSIIKMLYNIVTSVENNKYVSVCGEMASNLLSLPIFVGLKVNELSMNSHSIPIIKSAMNELEQHYCEDVLKECLKMSRHSEIENYLKETINSNIQKAKSVIKYEF